MPEFIFKGDWSFNIPLEKISKVDSDSWHYNEKSIEFSNLLSEGVVPFIISDVRNFDPDPFPEQLMAINYLINNEQAILDSVFDYFDKTVNPFFAEACGVWDWIPKQLSSNNLGQLLRINSITISDEFLEDCAYSYLEFEYKGDEEHGVVIILHKNRAIGFTDIGSFNTDIIKKDKEQHQKSTPKAVEIYGFQNACKIHTALEKHGKFKPWQLNDTENYFSGLLQQGKNKELIAAIESEKWNINQRFPSLDKNLADLAAYYHNTEAIEYLATKGGDLSKSILECTGYQMNKETLRSLVKNGANIDALNYWNVTPLYNEIKNFVNAILNRNSEEMETIGENIQFYLSLGADPMCCDSKKSDYKVVASKGWNQAALERHQIIEKVEKLIYPSKATNLKWQFWKKN